MKTTDTANFNPSEADFARFLYGKITSVPDYLLASYSQIGLSDRSLIDLLRVLTCYEKGSRFITFAKLMEQWQGQEQELRAALAALIQQGVLDKAVEAVQESYKLDGLYDKLLELWVFQHSVPSSYPQAKAQSTDEQAAGKSRQELVETIKAAYQLFEGELARPLSPLEMEKLNCWLAVDNWQLPMLREAMHRAVMYGAVSFAYIDKILLRWRREGIGTVEQLADDDMDKQNAKKAGDKVSTNQKNDKKNAGKTKGQNKTAEDGFVNKTDYRKYFGVK